MLFKRAGSAFWYSQYRDAGGKRVKRSTGTTDRREAGELEGKWRLEARQQRLWGTQPRFSFDDMMLRYLKETQGTKRSAERDAWTVKRLQPFFTGRVLNELKRADVALIRVEQLYPFPHKQFEAEMKRYPGAGEVVWCQEEPQNQGAWYQTAHYLRENMREDQKLYYAGRAASASPAGGYMAKHNERQKALVEQAFGKYK